MRRIILNALLTKREKAHMQKAMSSYVWSLSTSQPLPENDEIIAAISALWLVNTHPKREYAMDSPHQGTCHCCGKSDERDINKGGRLALLEKMVQQGATFDEDGNVVVYAGMGNHAVVTPEEFMGKHGSKEFQTTDNAMTLEKREDRYMEPESLG